MTRGFVILTCLVGLNALFVILSASEVSINLRCALNFFGFFCCGYALQPVGSLTLKMTRVWDFRFLTKAQNDNADLLRFAPCELLGGYA